MRAGETLKFSIDGSPIKVKTRVGPVFSVHYDAYNLETGESITGDYPLPCTQEELEIKIRRGFQEAGEKNYV